MTSRGHRLGDAAPPPAASALSIVAWVMIAVSLVATLTGLFWARLWLVGLVIAVVAFVLSIVVARRGRRGSVFADARVLVSLVALVLPIAIAIASLLGWAGRMGASPAAEELHIELHAEAEGDFTVTYSEPLAAGAVKSTTVEADASDSFEVAFSGTNSEIRFQAGISPHNIGPQTVSCGIRINGRTVMERTEEDRFVDCSANLQELYREQIGSE
ncbi:hypothetical protein [Leucobacter sp.]